MTLGMIRILELFILNMSKLFNLFHSLSMGSIELLKPYDIRWCFIDTVGQGRDKYWGTWNCYKSKSSEQDIVPYANLYVRYISLRHLLLSWYCKWKLSWIMVRGVYNDGETSLNMFDWFGHFICIGFHNTEQYSSNALTIET